MKRILLLCLTLSACAGNGSQSQRGTNSQALEEWVLWMKRVTNKEWFAVSGYPTYDECQKARPAEGACFPAILDPRDRMAWILWGGGPGQEFPIAGYPSNLACEEESGRYFEKSDPKIPFKCYPSTFDPRRR
jgi:hypothetical protein